MAKSQTPSLFGYKILEIETDVEQIITIQKEKHYMKRKQWEMILMAACWALWRERNSKIFGRGQPPLANIQAGKIVTEVSGWMKLGV
jgi:hypothetical protein